MAGAARSRSRASLGIGSPAETARSVRDADADTGKPLPAPLCGELERASGRNLDAVRVHDDAGAATAASGISAHAFALGPDIYFDQGAYDPGSRDGQRLIAHEVMHTQQHPSAPALMAKRAFPWPVTGPLTQPGDDTEAQADAFAEAFVVGRIADARGVAARPATMNAAVARSPRTAQAPAAAPEPAIRFRLGNESPGGKRYVRRGIPARVLSVPELITHVLVHAYGWPLRHAQGPFDEYWIAWDPADSSGITTAELQRAAGVVTIAISEKLDEYLTSEAERMGQSGRNGRDRERARAAAENAPGEADKLGRLGQDGKHDQSRATDAEPASNAGGRDTVSSRGLRIPDRLKSVIQGEPTSRAKSGSTWQTIIDELMAMSDEDLVYFRTLATHLTDEPERLLASIRLYKQVKADYLTKLEEALEEAAEEQRPLERASERAEPAEPPDPAEFRRWSPDRKREEARRRIEQVSRAQLAEMVKSPKQTIKEMAKAALRPDEAVADVQRDLRAVSEADGGWAKAARSVSAGSKFSGIIAGMLAFFAVASIFMPGVNALFLIQSSLVFMMGSAVLSLVESELHVRAAGEADSVEAFEEEIQLGVEAQTRGMVAVAGMATALAGALIARIPLPGRLQSVGNALTVARTSVARNIGEAWISVRATAVTKLRQATAGLLELLDRESRVLARAAAELDGMSAEQFYQRIARDDAFRDALGLRRDMAETLAELSRTGHGRETAHRVFQELRASFRDAPRLAREQLQTVIDQVERAIADLEAAVTPDDLAAALERAQAELSESSIASKLGERGAHQTAHKLESLVKQDGAEGRGDGPQPESAAGQVEPPREQRATAPGEVDPRAVKNKGDVPERYKDDPRFDDLARDPAHGNVPDPLGKSTREAMAALEAEARGLLEPPIRRGSAEIDFFDGNGVPWDVKTPVSPQEGQRWSFERSKPWKSIVDQLRKEQPNGNTGVMVPVRVLLDATYLKKADHLLLWKMLRKQATADELARIVEINVEF